MAQPLQTVLNEAMKLERSAVLGAAPCERTEARLGYATGCWPWTVISRLGKLHLYVPHLGYAEPDELLLPAIRCLLGDPLIADDTLDVCCYFIWPQTKGDLFLGITLLYIAPLRKCKINKKSHSA